MRFGLLNGGERPRDFLSLYLAHAGVSNTPDRFHFWSGVSLLSALASNRVWFQRGRGPKLYPNLYVFLIAESGIGKNSAIDCASKFVVDKSAVGLYAGEISYLSLLKRLASKNGSRSPSRMYLLTPELGMSVGTGVMADAFVKHMTELFSGRAAPFEKEAESSGSYKLYEPCINWLAGSTVSWMLDSITPQAVQSGFFARIIAVQERPDYSKRVYEPFFPDDYGEIVEELGRRVERLSEIGGPMRMSERARAIDQAWYLGRPDPESEALAPSWRRAPEIVLKIAMALALADYESTRQLIILGKHITRAQELHAEIEAEMPALVKIASANPANRATEVLREIVRGRKTIAHWQLIKRAHNRGLDTKQIKDGIATLIEAREWRWARLGKGMHYMVERETEG